jgi:Na+-driven multidrug efflux pump
MQVAALRNRVVAALQLGFSTALSTKASQAFGAGDRAAVMTWLAAAVFAGTVCALPMVGGLLIAEPVARVAFRQSEGVAREAAAFCARLAPGVIPQVRVTNFVTHSVIFNFVT